MTLESIGKLITNIYNSINPAIQQFRTLTASNTGEVVKSSKGSLYKINIINGAASIVYVKLYNKATAAASTDTPVLTIAVPTAVGSAVLRDFVKPQYFPLGISVRCVSEIADNGTTSPVAPIVEISYT